MQKMVRKEVLVMIQIFHQDSRGFTFMEAAVSLSLISFLIVAISSVQISVIRTFIAESYKIKKTYNVNLVERRLGRICDEIRIPFWINDPKIFSNANLIQFEYYKGFRNMTDFIFPNYVMFISSDYMINKKRRMLKIEYIVDGENIVYEKYF